ncbi:MAG: hypothetical protein LBU12_03610 [Deltaproteobacteria bacterium]|jgi:hypothetical protein|nr:hypothetical protein [Deltaproteobacteria bacterium]
MSDTGNSLDDITLQEAKNALEDPEKGSLRVLKALGRLRDQYTVLLAEGALRLEVQNDLELVAAEAALEAYAAELAEDGLDPPKVNIVRLRAAFK